MLLVRGDDAIADAAWKHEAQDDRVGVDRLARQRSQRFDDEAGEIGVEPRRIETELLPFERKEARRNRSARDARDSTDGSEHARLVEPPQNADVKNHRAIASAREAQADAALRTATGLVGRYRLNGILRHGT